MAKKTLKRKHIQNKVQQERASIPTVEDVVPIDKHLLTQVPIAAQPAYTPDYIEPWESWNPRRWGKWDYSDYPTEELANTSALKKLGANQNYVYKKQILDTKAEEEKKKQDPGTSSTYDEAFNKYYNFIKENEGSVKDKKTGLFIPYPSPEDDGTYTVAYGHKLKKGQENNPMFKNGLTEEQAAELFKNDFQTHYKHAKKFMGKEYFNALPYDQQMMLTDYNFNTKKGLPGFPKFVNAIKAYNDASTEEEKEAQRRIIAEEYTRKYDDSTPLYQRNNRTLDNYLIPSFKIKKAMTNPEKYTHPGIPDPNWIYGAVQPIDDNRGQWEHPGEVTRIASNNITMQGVPYPVLGVGADGEQRMMYPNEEHTFNEAPVTEYPMMQAKDGGWLTKYEKAGPVKPIIVAPGDPRLKSYQDSLNTYNVSNNFNKEYKIVPVTESDSDEAKKFIEHSKKNNLPYKDAFYSPKIGIVYGTPPKKPVRKVLTEGSEGANNVRKQEELINAGYNITVDGVWGNQSQKAWDDYQERLNPKKQKWEPNQEDLRSDGTQKGTGYFGVMKRPDGDVSTEISMGVEVDGKEIEIPTMVPTLNKQELDYLLNNPVNKPDLFDTNIGKSIMDKAYKHAMERMDKGLSPFYQEGEPRQQLPSTPVKKTVPPEPRPSFPPGATIVPDKSLVGDWSEETKKQKGLRTLKEKYTNEDGVLKTRQTIYDSKGNVLETKEDLPGNYKRGGVTWLNEYQKAGTVMPADVMMDPKKLAQWMKDHPEFHANANTPTNVSSERNMPYATSDNTNVVINTPKGPVNTGTRNAPNVRVPGGGVSKNTVKDIEILLDLAEFYPPTAVAAYIAGVPFTVMDLYDDYKKGSQPAEYVLDALGLIPGEKLGSKAASELLNLANFGVDVKDYPEHKYGGRTFSAGGEKHKVYKKESPTGNGKGVKGHIMVTHPTMDKGKWDTIDLTKIAGAKTVAQGVAATKKWHRENPEYQEGGGVSLVSPEYAEYQFFQSLQTSPSKVDVESTTVQEPSIETNTVSEKRTKGYNETLLNKLKQLINPGKEKDFEGTTDDDLLQLGTNGKQKGLIAPSIFSKPEDIDFGQSNRQQQQSYRNEIKIEKGKPLSVEQIAQLAKKIGFNDTDAAFMAAVAMRESAGNPGVDTYSSGLDPEMKREYSLGLTQINWKAHKNWLPSIGITSPEQLRDPETNLKAAYQLYRKVGNFSPWSGARSVNQSDIDKALRSLQQ